MCGPAGAIGGGLGILRASAELDAEREQAGATIAATITDARNQLAAIEFRGREEDAKIEQKKFERRRLGVRERGAVKAATAESGAAGKTPLRQIQASFIQEELDQGVLEATKESNKNRVLSKSGFTKAAANARINSIQDSLPNDLQKFLRITTGGIGGAARLQGAFS